MNQLNTQQIGQHVTVLGWLNIAASAILFVVAAFIFFLLTGLGIAAGDPEAVAVLGVIGTAVGIFLAFLALPGILAGVGLLMGKGWGRILAIVVGILNLINFPIGTLIGAYTLWVLMQDAAPTYFEAGKSAQ